MEFYFFLLASFEVYSNALPTLFSQKKLLGPEGNFDHALDILSSLIDGQPPSFPFDNALLGLVPLLPL